MKTDEQKRTTCGSLTGEVRPNRGVCDWAYVRGNTWYHRHTDGPDEVACGVGGWVGWCRFCGACLSFDADGQPVAVAQVPEEALVTLQDAVVAEAIVYLDGEVGVNYADEGGRLSADYILGDADCFRALLYLVAGGTDIQSTLDAFSTRHPAFDVREFGKLYPHDRAAALAATKKDSGSSIAPAPSRG